MYEIKNNVTVMSDHKFVNKCNNNKLCVDRSCLIINNTQASRVKPIVVIISSCVFNFYNLKFKICFDNHFCLISDRRHQCLTCGRLYTYHRGLVRHMTYECGVDSKFKCAMCGRPFKRKENMKSHMINIHKLFC